MKSPEPRLQRLLEEAPYVRLLARQLLADEADDVEQQTWLQAIQHGGEQVEAPRAWLARIVRNVATSLHRVRARQRRDEPAGDAHGAVPSSAELMQQEEQRRLLVAAVDRLPEPLRAVVLLRYFEGLLPQAIAMRLGMPVTTVWNQLRRALQLLRERLDADHGGDRRAWMLPLVPFAVRADDVAGTLVASKGVAVGVGLGVVAMTMKTKLMAAAGLMVGAIGALILWAMQDPVPGSPDAVAQVAVGAAAESANLAHDGPAVGAGIAAPREAVANPQVTPATAGSLVVHVRYGDDKSPASGVRMNVRRSGTDPRTASQSQHTDASGRVRFAGLGTGNFVVTSDRFSWHRAQVREGETAELHVLLEVGLSLTGLVVDSGGVPVAGATIEMRSLASSEDPEWLATSGTDGRFLVRAAPTILLVGARADGHCASRQVFVHSKDGNAVDVRLQLGPSAGRVEGIVVDGCGQPIAGAGVCIGSGSVKGTSPTDAGAPPLPALVRTDEYGRFVAIGIAPGTHPVVALAAQCAPWQGQCEVVAHLGTPLRITMGPGGRIRGSVRTADGLAAAGVFVRVGEVFDFQLALTNSDADGTFELSGLPVGDVVVLAQDPGRGKAEQRVRTDAGRTTACELQLVVGVELRGRVVDEDGAPIARAYIDCEAKGAGAEWGTAATDAEGRFVLKNCPVGERVHVTVRASGFQRLDRSGVDPGGGALDLVMRRSLPGTARITGVVVDPDGNPAGNAVVFARRVDAQDARMSEATGTDGRFAIEGLVPGTWTASIRAVGYPQLACEMRLLGVQGVWDMGMIALRAGGKAVVTIDGDRTGVWFQFLGADNRPRTDWMEKDGTLVSPDLVAGQHRLLVAGKTVAAQAIPFVVRAGEVTKVAVRLGPGTRQRFELAAAALDPLPRLVTLRIHRGNELLCTTGVALQAGQVSADETCLLPGDYVVTVFDRDRQLASLPFQVGAIEAPPVRLELQ